MDSLLVFKELVKTAKIRPESSAIHDSYGTLSYAELLEEVHKVRYQLISRGVRSGHAVGVKARNSRNFIVSVFAVLGCGAAVMPISHQLKRRELDEILELARLHALIDDSSGIVPIQENRIELNVDSGSLFFSNTSISSEEQFAPYVDAPAFIRFTSGTTGSSKGVVIDNQAVIDRTDAANKALKLNDSSNVICVLPMAYHFVVSIVLYVRVGAAITIVKNFMAKDIITMTNKFFGTLLYASPMQIRLLATDQGAEMLDSLEMVISTSSGISKEISNLFRKRFHKTVHQAFGIIEVGLPIINREEGAEYLDYVGTPLPDFDVQVFDEDYNKLPAGQVGLLGIKGPGMFAAYLNPSEIRQDILINGYFFSADYAVISENGMVKIEGRKKSMINIAGNKVFAEEVELVLEELECINKAKVSGIAHQLLGQIIQAEIITEDGFDIDEENILSYCRKHLSTFKIPQKLIVVDEFKMTDSGKLIRH